MGKGFIEDYCYDNLDKLWRDTYALRFVVLYDIAGSLDSKLYWLTKGGWYLLNLVLDLGIDPFDVSETVSPPSF